MPVQTSQWLCAGAIAGVLAVAGCIPVPVDYGTGYAPGYAVPPGSYPPNAYAPPLGALQTPENPQQAYGQPQPSGYMQPGGAPSPSGYPPSGYPPSGYPPNGYTPDGQQSGYAQPNFYAAPNGYAPPDGSAPPYAPPPGTAQPGGYAPPSGYPPTYGQQSGYAGPPQGRLNAVETAYGATCYAGVYTCAVPQSLPVGTQCSCPGLGAPSYGSVH